MPDIRVWCGQAHRLLTPVITAIGDLHRQEKPCILLVPEQFTLQAERELLDRLQIPGFFTIDVLSPSRLSSRVLAAAGADALAPLSSAGRRMAVSYALERCEKELTYYQSAAHRRGFTEKLTSLLADMKRGGLTPEMLTEYAQSAPEGLHRAKLHDLAVIFTAYESTLFGRFGDSEDQLRFVASQLPQSGLMQGQHIFVYGFDALPEQMITLLCEIGALCEQLTVALLCRPQTSPDAELYRPVRGSIARFAVALQARGLSLTQTYLPASALPHAPAIRHLDDTLFAYPDYPFSGEQDSVFLSQHMSPFEEATYAARQIMRLCAEGTDIERITVLYPDRNGYAFAVAAALRDSGLPFYTDEKLPASSHALSRFLLSALRAMASGYQREDVIAVMKSGYSPLSFPEACTLENYARENGINRKRWTEPFHRGKPETVVACEVLRQKLMEPLMRARAAIVAARSTDASLQAVIGLLTDVNAYATLQQEEEALLRENMLVRAGQNSQVWQAILALTDQLHALSGGARIPLAHIAERFDCGFSAISLAALPPASGMLHAGTLGHSLSGDMDAVFLLGLNDGILSKQADSLLTEEERAQTQEATGTYLGMTDESRALFARMDVKHAMTLPAKWLFLSHAKTDPTGKAMRPLDLLSTLQTRLLPSLQEKPVPPEVLPVSATQALNALSTLLRNYADGMSAELSPLWQERLAKLLACPDTAYPAARLLRAADYRVQSVPLAGADARALFNDRTLSVSRLEEFAACPFKHFIQYGLRPEIVRDWGVEPVDLGQMYHSCLQNFAALTQQKPSYPHISEQEVLAMADEAVTPMLSDLLQSPMGDTQRSLAGFAQARRVIRRACETVTRHLAAGTFKLYQAEARFGYPDAQSIPPVLLHLQDGTTVTLHGKIDRIDRYDSEDGAYLRIVDYKSSQTTLEPAKTWWGLQLQLIVYLDAATGGTPGSKPAGAFYFHVDDPLVKLASDDAVQAEQEIIKQLQMKGVALADEAVLSAMDSGDTPVAMPSALLKSGGMRKGAKVLDMPQMQALIKHARQQAEALAESLYGGDTAILPVQYGDTQSCEHCNFQRICGFDANARGALANEIPPMEMEELTQKLAGPPTAQSNENNT